MSPQSGFNGGVGFERNIRRCSDRMSTASLLIVALSLPAGSAYAFRIAARPVASIGDENAGCAFAPLREQRSQMISLPHISVYFSCESCGATYEASQDRNDRSGKFHCVHCARLVHQWSGTFSYLGWRLFRTSAELS